MWKKNSKKMVTIKVCDYDVGYDKKERKKNTMVQQMMWCWSKKYKGQLAQGYCTYEKKKVI